ncbi:glycosyltransferase family 2 protein [Arthrobacter sunyaminii]|uniref:glycosyltransferase family 2 protein n=1 Tax=Arthrobacter sunyaminii TaxID=2816859 RepID=UPI001A93B353|nr:glycosyltransferase family 2 protein [Arthrobacter sunyaminii]MBO0897789.1 glycosyltransferase family 2 protein [Arthrobacter sunyaminii]
MTAEPEVLGIYIPFWGDLGYLRTAVESVRSQTSPHWRLTVINDDYPDRAVDEYFAGLAEEPRIRYIRNPENCGITENFRRCVQMATEPRLVIMGCDDFMLPGYVETVMAAHRAAPRVGIIQPGVQVVDEHGKQSATLADSVKQKMLRPRTPPVRTLHGDRLMAGLMHGNWLYWPSLAFRRDAVQTHDFRDDFSVIQDLALILDLIMDGEDLMVLPDPVFCYRRHSSSASSLELVDGSRFEGERRFFSLAASLTADKGWSRTRRAARLHLTSRAHALVLVPGALRSGNTRAVPILLRHAFGS